MDCPESKKQQSRSNRAGRESAAADDSSPVDGTGDGGGATATTPINGSGGSSAFGTYAGNPWWTAPSLGPAFPVHSPPRSSEWMYSQGGFMNMLQSSMLPGMNYPNGSQQPQNYHLVGEIMSHSATSPTSACSKGTQSPTESSAAAQVGSQEKETIEIEDSDTIQPARSNARVNSRSNARSIATSIAKSDRRLTWSNEVDIRLVSAWLHNSIDPIDENDKKSDQYWSDVTSTYNSTTKCD